MIARLHHLSSGNQLSRSPRAASNAAFLKRSVTTSRTDKHRSTIVQDIQTLVHQSENVTVTAEVKCYLQNIVTFLRLHRAVDGGITPRATKYFGTLIKYACLSMQPHYTITHLLKMPSPITRSEFRHTLTCGPRRAEGFHPPYSFDRTG